MKRYDLIKDGEVLMSWSAGAGVPAHFQIPGTKDFVDGAAPGWVNKELGYEIKEVEVPDPPPPDPKDIEPRIEPLEDISKRQFFEQLAIDGEITWPEAEAAVGRGEIPQAFLPLVAALPAQQRQKARMFLIGAATFRRNHAITKFLLQQKGWDDARADKFWKDAAALV